MKYVISGRDKEEVQRRIVEAVKRGHVQLTELDEQINNVKYFNPRFDTSPYKTKYRVQMMIQTKENGK